MQAMHKLGEPTALVKVRQADTMLAKEILEPARKQYAGGADAQGLWQVALVVRPSPSSARQSCAQNRGSEP